MGATARVITASNRAAAGVYEDRTGPLIVDWLRVRGYDVPAPVVVPDGGPVAAALRTAVAEGVQVVITTGGTGITPTDRTPEATSSVLDYEIPGLADAVRAAGQPEVPTAALSRGLAGVAGKRWSSTSRAPPAESGTDWAFWTPFWTTPWIRSAAATTSARQARSYRPAYCGL